MSVFTNVSQSFKIFHCLPPIIVYDPVRKNKIVDSANVLAGKDMPMISCNISEDECSMPLKPGRFNIQSTLSKDLAKYIHSKVRKRLSQPQLS